VVVANVDRLFLVATPVEPPLHLEFMDRVLVAAERGGVPVTIVLNKVDLLRDRERLEEVETLYGRCGYRTVRTSAATGEGMDALKRHFQGEVFAFVGESGVGKSSLLNRLDPSLRIRVGELARTGRGRHTTTSAQLHRLQFGYVADTPGMQTFGFPGEDPTELGDCFPEFRPFAESCRFHPCTHSHEPDCAVQAALAEGRIAQSRYRSYRHMLAEVLERLKHRYD